MSDITRLQGDDGFVVIGDLKDVITTADGTKTLDELCGGLAASKKGEGFYRVSVKAAVSGLGNLEERDVFYSDGALVLKTGDAVFPLPDFKVGGKPVKSWKLQFKRKETDATTLLDDNDVFLLGRRTITGSLAFVEDVNEDTVVKRFTDTVSGVTKTKASKDAIWCIMFQQGDFIPGEKVICFVGKFEIGSYEAGAQAGSLQEYTVEIKPAVGEKVSRVTIDVPA